MKTTINKKLNFIVIIWGLLFIVLLFSSCIKDNTNNYSLENVLVGDTFEITLDAYGGTAYCWDYSINSNGIEYVTSKFISEQPSDSDFCGGGKLVYTFRAVKVGNYKIKFKLSTINQSKQPIETNIYNIKIIK